MSGILSNIAIPAKVEFLKLISKTKVRVIIILIAVVSFGASVFSSGGLAVQVAGINLNFPNGAFFVLNALNAVILPLTVFMLAADIISHEFADHTIRAGLLRPVSKLNVYLSKWLAAVLFGACCLGVSFLFGGFVSVILRQTGLLSAFAAYIVSIFPLCAFAAMASLISSLIKSPAMATFLATALYIIMSTARFISTTLEVMLFTTHVNWYRMFLGPVSSMPISNMINTAVMMVAYTSIFLTAGYLVFSAKKI